MTKVPAKQRATRVPSAKGLDTVPPSSALLSSKVEENLFSAVPKDYTLWSTIPKDSLEGADLGSIRVDNYPMCCGAGIAHSFIYSNHIPAGQKNVVIREIERRLKSQLRGIGMLIINDSQINAWKKSLFDNGWTCVTASSNPAHFNDTTVYLFTKTFGAKKVELPKKESVAA